MGMRKRLVRGGRAAIAGSLAIVGGTLRAPVLVAQSPEPTRPASMPHQAMAWGTQAFVLSEVLEFAPAARDASVRYDLVGWYGGAERRVWVKADGVLRTDGGRGRTEVQALYGRLVAPFWDLQAGLWVDADVGTGAARAFGGAALGAQGLAPGWFELEPALLVSSKGDIGTRFTGSFDVYLSQRLVVQPRIETSAWARARPEFGIGSGIGESEFGLRARYEVRREFAPYVGVAWERRFGASGALARAAGRNDRETFFTVGVRAWW